MDTPFLLPDWERQQYYYTSKASIQKVVKNTIFFIFKYVYKTQTTVPTKMKKILYVNLTYKQADRLDEDESPNMRHRKPYVYCTSKSMFFALKKINSINGKIFVRPLYVNTRKFCFFGKKSYVNCTSIAKKVISSPMPGFARTIAKVIADSPYALFLFDRKKNFHFDVILFILFLFETRIKTKENPPIGEIQCRPEKLLCRRLKSNLLKSLRYLD